jgi:hypothetical protein
MTCRIRHRCNSLGAILEAEALGYGGAEIDLVWEDGELVLSHEHGGTGQLFHWALDHVPEDFVLALNVKEYGMAEELSSLLVDRCSDYFVFDVPGPELLEYAHAGLRVFGRCSELEAQAAEQKIVDSFYSGIAFVLEQLESGDALISPTLRGLPEWPAEVLSAATFVITK